MNDQNIDPKEIEKKISKKTKAIMPVHLSGRSSEMDAIIKISKKYKIPVIEMLLNQLVQNITTNMWVLLEKWVVSLRTL